MKRTALALTLFAALLSGSGIARAGMVLTSAGTADGFSLTTFVSGFPTQTGNGGAAGPLGITLTSTGSVLVTDWNNGQLYKFTDTNGQTVSNGTLLQTYGNNAYGLVTTGSGTVFMTQEDNGTVEQIDPTTGLVVPGSITTLSANIGTLAVVVNPNNGKLFVSTIHGGIYQADPVAKTSANFNSASVDGLAVSPVGIWLYSAGAADIVRFNISTGVQDPNFNVPVTTPDGLAFGGGAFSNTLFVNTNGGNLAAISNLNTTPTLTTIATGGSRGDFVTVDPTNGSLFLTQTDSIIRLTAPSGDDFPDPPGSFGTVPEPGSLLLLGLGGVALFGYGWKLRKSKAATQVI